MGKIAVTLTDASPESLDAARRADLVELRLDHLGASALDGLLGRFAGRAMVAFRRPRDGGAPSRAPESERVALLQSAARDARAAYVDFELDCVEAIPRDRKAKIVVSHHDFERTPGEEDLLDILARIEASGADVAKVVTTARSESDAFALYGLYRRSRGSLVAFAMGEYGGPSRILALRLGAPFTFASVGSGREGAPGQMSLDEMLGLYRADRITVGTALYGVIGDPIAHSMSPAIHNAAFAELGIDAVYLPFRVSGDPAEFVRRMADEAGLSGMSVTIPHKEGVIAALDEIEPVAKRCGAVNTVAVRAGKLYGLNSDAAAACDSLEAACGGKLALSGRAVVVLGAGGAARAIVHGLAARGARVFIVNRTRSRAEKLAAETGSTVASIEEVPPLGAGALVNATSVGMSPNTEESPVPRSCLRKGLVVFDTVYNPLRTRLLREAARAECLTVDGLEMFVGQAAVQFRLWTGREAPVELMRRVALDRLRSPGAGRKGADQ